MTDPRDMSSYVSPQAQPQAQPYVPACFIHHILIYSLQRMNNIAFKG